MTASAPDVAIVIPCYNAAEFIGDAVERLLTQEGVTVEIVLIDDASTDGTAAILRDLDERHPAVRAVLLPENGGVAAAREAGVAAATAEYVWFVDADDTWPQDAASALRRTAEATGADIVCADAVVIAEGRPARPVATLPAEDVLDGSQGLPRLLVGEITGHLWNKLFRRSLLQSIEFTRIRQHSDQAMVAQALVRARIIAVLRTCVYEYRLRAGSIIRSGSRRAESLATLGAVVEQSVARLDATALRRPQYRYYRARYNTLSRLKDATSGSYEPDERRALLRGIRSGMSAGDLAALLRRRDAVRSGLYALALVSPRAYGILLDKAGGRL